MAKSGVAGLFLSKEQRERSHHAMLKEQADYLVSELGKLKGSVVKVGQMLALYGEHILPREVVDALHTLDAQTTPLAWQIIHQAVQDELGDRMDDFNIEHTPIGTASLAQVHRARHGYSGREVVLKVQYPSVAEAIDADLSIFKQLLKVTNAVPQTRVLDAWFDEIRELLYREVDYQLEATTTKRFAGYLQDDARYIVPTIYDNYSTERLICMSYEAGVHLADERVLNLSQERRNQLGQAAIQIVLREIFEWGEMQTDPNFGNYLVRINDNSDQLVLLDFGAIKAFDDKLLTIAKNLLRAGYHQDKAMMKAAMTGYAFFDELTGKPKDDMADVFLMACEPFAHPDRLTDKRYLDVDGCYLWAHSDLYNRVMMTAKRAMTSTKFSLPPKEMMFISRKFIGAYAMMSALDARTDSRSLVGHYV